MNIYFAIATALSVFIVCLHFFLGGAQIARPLLDAKGLTDEVRCVQYFCWHIATVTLVLQAALFGVAAASASETSLAIAGTALAAAIGMLGVLMPPALKISYKTMPQGWLFVPVAALGVAGLAV